MKTKPISSKTMYKVTIGGWYQRTTLHLTEIYDLFSSGFSNLDLDKNNLKEYYRNFNFISVKREAGCLESIVALTKDGIEVKYYEDGLYVLQTEDENVVLAEDKLRKYHDNVLSPAVSFIFSKGAPTPKILANIKTVYPAGIGVIDESPNNYIIDESIFGTVYSKVESEGIVVFKTPKYIFVISKKNLIHTVSDIIEMQVFFREFKDQLQKYLNIHRNIWEEISTIKEQKQIKGSQVNEIRGKLDSYQTSISLIKNRINQMGIYVNTRSSLAKKLEIEDKLIELFEYKFEVLSDSLSYIKEVWAMTSDYLSSAIQNILEIKSQSTANGVESLRFITSISVLSSIIGYLSIKAWPAFSPRGVIYFVSILATALILNLIVIRIYKNRSYKLKFGNRKENL